MKPFLSMRPNSHLPGNGDFQRCFVR
jgi:hypothetical protein